MVQSVLIRGCAVVMAAFLLVSCSENADNHADAVADKAAKISVPYLDIQEVTTPKGIAVWYVQDKTIPAFSLQFSVAAGAASEPQGLDGIGKLLSTLLDEGAGKRDAEAFQNEMDQHGVKIGFSSGRDTFSGSLTTTVQYQDIAVEMFSQALSDPHLSNDAIGRMKDALLSDLRFNQMNPQWVAARTLFETMFAGQSYARPNGGTEETISRIVRNDLTQYRSSLLCRDNLKIAVAGDVSSDDLARNIDLIFGGWPACQNREVVSNMQFENSGKIVQVERQGAQASVLMAQPGVARQDDNWWAARILDFALGGGQFSSRLMDEVRVKRSLTYGVSSAILSYEYAPVWLVQSGVSPENADKAMTLIKEIWSDVAQNGLTDNEIKAAKDYLVGSLPLVLTSMGQISSVLLQLQEDGLPKDTLDRRKAEIDAVTADDIRRVAAQYLHADKMVTIIVGPPVPVSQKTDGVAQ